MNFCGLEFSAEGVLTQLRKGISQCQEHGGVLNLYDERGLAGHVSWCLGSDAELLLPLCWQIHWIVVRPDLHGREISKLLYVEASKKMNLAKTPLVCARVQSGNLASLKTLEALGGVRVAENYLIA